MRSSGCSINVEVTPPETPATRCSYLTCENTLTFILFEVDCVALAFILIFFFYLFTLYCEFLVVFKNVFIIWYGAIPLSAAVVRLYNIFYLFLYCIKLYLQSLASNLILKSYSNHRNSLHMAAIRFFLLLGADLVLLLLLLFLTLLLVLLLLLRILIHFCLCFVVAEHIFSLWQISAVRFSSFIYFFLTLSRRLIVVTLRL